MARRLPLHCFRSTSLFNGLRTTFALLLCWFTAVRSNEVLVPERVSAVLGKNVTLGCRVEVGTNLSLTQSSWERRLPAGTVTLAVFNPQFGISVAPEYERRVSFLNPSAHDASIILQGVGFADIGSYTCKVATFPLGNTQASTTIDILVEPKVYVSAGSPVLLDGGNATLVASCTAERGRPAAQVSWESELLGRSEEHAQDEPNGTTTSQVRYFWPPTRHAQGHALTCVVRHPALLTEFRIPYVLNVQYAPDVMVVGNDKNWYVGQENVKLDCRANANPPAQYFIWSRLAGPMPDGAEQVNRSLVFNRPLERNDSGEYRCEVQNDIGLRFQSTLVSIQEPPSTTAVPTTSSAAVIPGAGHTSTPPDRWRAPHTSPTLASLPDGSLGTVVGGAVGGVLLLVLLLVLGAACYARRRRTFRGDYYTKQYLGPADMQKEAQLDVLEPHELQEVYGGGDSGKGSQDLKPKQGGGDLVYADYATERADREEWGDGRRLQREGSYYPEHNVHPSGPPVHAPAVNNGSPYLPEDRYDNGTDSDYVSHMDGSVISRREWYV